MTMEFRVLGPVEVRIGDHDVHVGAVRPRSVLATLLLRANEVIHYRRLVELAWPDAPRSAASNVRSYLGQLRRMLRPPGETGSRLRTCDRGYVLEVRPGELDLASFTQHATAGEQALEQARNTGDWENACHHLEQALRYWRGSPLQNVQLGQELEIEAVRIAEQGTVTQERYFVVKLALGHHAQVLPQLRAFVAADPLRESAISLLMTALHRAQRRAEAMEVFRQARRQLKDELGVEPGDRLQQQHQHLLAGDPHPDTAGTAPAPAGGDQISASDVLPAEPAPFVGRTAHRAALTAPCPIGGAPRIVAVHGMPGVGKTALVVHSAHSLYRQGQIQVTLTAHLHAHDPHRPPADPAAVAHSWLRHLGAGIHHLGTLDVAGLRAEVRRRVAGRTVLVLLDDAANADQITPLLLDIPGSLTLVTSRQQLTDLPTAEHLRLTEFTACESTQLLDATLHPTVDVPEHDRGTLADIAGAVGHLPLALTLVARQIAASPDWTLNDHLQRLRGHHDHLRLDSAVDTALTLSYERLPAACQRLFRTLALHPGPHVDLHAATALADSSLADTARDLHLLRTANLLHHDHHVDHYRLHDLTRLYAARCAHDHDPARAHHAALDRLYTHYTHHAAQAMNLLAPHERHQRPTVPAPTTPHQPPFTDRHTALTWLDRELLNLIATASQAGDRGRHEHAAHLSAILYRYLDTSGHYHDAEVLHTHASHTPQPADRAWALTRLAATHWRTARYHETVETLHQATAAFRAAGDRLGEGYAWGNLSMASVHLGQHDEAHHAFQRSLDIALHLDTETCTDITDLHYERQGRHPQADAPSYLLAIPQRIATLARACGDRLSESNALGDIAISLRHRGKPQVARDHLRAALAIAQQIGHHIGEIDLLCELGETALTEHDPARALENYRSAEHTARSIRDPYRRACALNGIARCHHAQGDTTLARSYWQRSLQLHTALGTPEADSVHHRLNEPHN